MRALKRMVLIGFVLSFATSAWAAQSVGLVVSQTSQTLNVSEIEKKTSSTVQDFSYRIEDVSRAITSATSGKLNYSGDVILSQPDYSGVLLRQRNGKTVALSLEKKTESKLSQALEFERSGLSSQLKWTGNVSESPYSTQAAGLRFEKKLFDSATIVALSGGLLLQHQPKSTYVNSEFETVFRPSLVHGNEIVASIDQLLTEELKVALDLKSGQRVEERPRYYGFSLASAFALTSGLTVGIRSEYVFEPESTFASSTGANGVGSTARLYNERGALSYFSPELSLSYEPRYDWLVTASYGLGIERELDLATATKIQLGTDQFGLGIKYIKTHFEVSAMGAYLITNQSTSQVLWSGGLLWRI